MIDEMVIGENPEDKNALEVVQEIGMNPDVFNSVSKALAGMIEVDYTDSPELNLRIMRELHCLGTLKRLCKLGLTLGLRLFWGLYMLAWRFSELPRLEKKLRDNIVKLWINIRPL